MPVTYTNRKGLTYYLCQGVTRTGKPRYYFARKPQGQPVEEIPAGFKIGESVNGLVFLERERAAQILPAEVAAVEAAVKRHPKPRDYRVSGKHDRIEVYERIGADPDELTSRIAGVGGVFHGKEAAIREFWRRAAGSRRCYASSWLMWNGASFAWSACTTAVATSGSRCAPKGRWTSWPRI